MSLRVVIVAAFVCCATARQQALAADAPLHPASVLAGVAVLEKPVSLWETKIPLGELIQKVAADTGVALTAARSVADEPVAVVVNEYPARQLLEQTARLLDFQWSRQGREGRWRYEIDQDLAARQREEALRHKAQAAVEERMRRQIQGYSEIAALPPEQFRALLAQADRREQELSKLSPEQRQQRLNDPTERERSRRCEIARALWTPANRALARLLQGLTPQQQANLRREGWIAFSTDPTAGEQRLPVEVDRVFRASEPSLFGPGQTALFPDPEERERYQREEQEMRERWRAATGSRITIRMGTDRFTTRGTLHLYTFTLPLRDGRPDVSAGNGMGGRIFLYAGPEDSDQQQERVAEATPERRAALEKDPLLGARKLFRTAKHPPEGLGRKGARLRFRELLPELARTYAVQFLSDAYTASSPRVEGDLSAGESTPLYALLDRFAGATHRWDHEGTLIRLRSRTWAFDRPREVPLRLVRRWKQIGEERGLLPLEEYLEMATTLTDAQLDSLDEVEEEAGWPYGSVASIQVQMIRYALRLYASLSPAQRQALDLGAVLPVERMTPTQRDLFLAGLKEHSRRREPPIPLDLAHWAEGSFAVTRERLVRTIKEEGGSPVTYLERPQTPAGEAAAAVPPGTAAGTQPRRSTEPAGAGLERKRDPRAPLPFLQMQFHFQYGPELRESDELGVPGAS